MRANNVDVRQCDACFKVATSPVGTLDGFVGWFEVNKIKDINTKVEKDACCVICAKSMCDALANI